MRLVITVVSVEGKLHSLYFERLGVLFWTKQNSNLIRFRNNYQFPQHNNPKRQGLFNTTDNPLQRNGYSIRTNVQRTWCDFPK